MLEMLLEYRFAIWLLGGSMTYWLIGSIPAWQRVARAGTWNAERDYATWRVRNALFVLILLIPLLVLTTAAAWQS